MSATKGSIPWNKGKLTPKRVKQKISRALIGKSSGTANTVEKETERKRKISQTMKNKKLGGYRKGSGRGKKGYYKGYWCDSSWELAWVIYNLDHNILFEKNWERFSYEFNGEQHYYIPDFKKQDTYVEIKGYLNDQNKEKIKQFPYKLNVLKYNELKPILDYVKTKYGKSFIYLYE